MSEESCLRLLSFVPKRVRVSMCRCAWKYARSFVWKDIDSLRLITNFMRRKFGSCLRKFMLRGFP